jgi:bifunctional pyridoxal-dependent enzyme with beta-cystathionase and maltose regulon repressor activities
MPSRRRFRSAHGEKIGPWPIVHLSENELVAGRNNKHLDFRLSVLKETSGAIPTAVVSTICTPHNAFGKVYLVRDCASMGGSCTGNEVFVAE